MIIDQAAMLTLRLHLIDRQALQDEALSERNGGQYLAWSAALNRLLRPLGLQGAADKPPGLQDYLAARSAQAPAAA
jgi:hypothetical protein